MPRDVEHMMCGGKDSARLFAYLLRSLRAKRESIRKGGLGHELSEVNGVSACARVCQRQSVPECTRVCVSAAEILSTAGQS